MTLLYVLLAIVLLGVLIMVHELGHFTASRLCGIAVKEFSIGFGPNLVHWKSKKHETDFYIRPIPLGGYCMFYGDTDDDPDGKTKDDPRNYNKAPVWKRMISVVAGPLMNMVLAFVVAIGLMFAYGQIATTPFIVSVTDGMPAAQAGLQSGDVFVSVAGNDVTDLSVSAVSEAIGEAFTGEPVDITISRNGQELTFAMLPRFDEAEQRYLVGITIQQGAEKMPAGQVLPAAWDTCVEASGAILNALGKLFTTGEGLDQTTGPVGVVQQVAEQTQAGGIRIFLYLMVLISINLGLMNLLPIPGLDGSRLVFMLIEAVRGKPVSQRIESIIHLCGYAFLFLFMLFFTFKDVLRIFGV